MDDDKQIIFLNSPLPTSPDTSAAKSAITDISTLEVVQEHLKLTNELTTDDTPLKSAL